MEIYAVKISNINEEKLDELSLFISQEKKYKIERFINTKDKLRALIGEILIRTIIMEMLNMENKNIILNKNQYGKPFFENYLDLNFNISHSEDFVVCAIDNKPVGIDIEKVKPIEFKEIAEHFFSENEFNYITTGNLASQLNNFYKIWTLKESYTKCCGQGLSIPLKSFSINVDMYDNIKVENNNKYTDYILKLFNIDSDYRMAICSLNKEISNNIIMIDQSNLINKYLEFILN